MLGVVSGAWRPDVRTRGDGSTTMLSAGEIADFKRYGFVIKRNVLDRELTGFAVERVWRELPPAFRRDEPSSWSGVVTDSCETRSVEERRGRLKYRDSLWHEATLRRLGTGDPSIRSAARQLLGSRLPAEQRIRGIYLVLPCAEAPRQPLLPHIDRHIFQFGFVGYLDVVNPNAGAFCVWPGSHHWVWQRLGSQTGLLSHETRDALAEEFVRKRPMRPFRFVGNAGDVIFYHHRLFHAAGLNLSSSIRYAVLGDFARRELLRKQMIEKRDDPWRDWAI